MQHINSTESSSGGGRLFAGERDILFRPQHRDPKCPRCDSLNTKFCYYNNYNLSQPRHFCKSCRRYWTKGGVLRNVPVGGGIRKTKRSGKPKSKPNIIPSTDAVPVNRRTSNSQNSSSDSSRTTATATATATATTDVSVGNSTNSTPAMLLNVNESSSSTRFLNFDQFSTPIPTFDSLMLNQSSVRNMSTEIGTFRSTTTSSSDRLPLEFNTTAGIPSFQLQSHQENQLRWTEADVKMPEMRSSKLSEQTADIGYMGVGRRRSDGGFAGGDDWQDNRDEGLYDLTGTVDQSYWCQSQWNGDHHHLNFLP